VYFVQNPFYEIDQVDVYRLARQLGVHIDPVKPNLANLLAGINQRVTFPALQPVEGITTSTATATATTTATDIFTATDTPPPDR
jgi:hypothetical protein